MRALRLVAPRRGGVLRARYAGIKPVSAITLILARWRLGRNVFLHGGPVLIPNLVPILFCSRFFKIMCGWGLPGAIFEKSKVSPKIVFFFFFFVQRLVLTESEPLATRASISVSDRFV